MDPRSRSDVEAVAGLHEQFLGDSPVARMGPAFVRDVYYSKLIVDGLYDCLVCRSAGRVVAFLSYTDRPLDLMSRGLKRHFFSVAWSVGRTVVTSPRRLRDVLYVLRIMGDHDEAKGDSALLEGAAEALSMAVLPEFQNVVPEGGKSRVAVRLIESMAADLRERKVHAIAFYVDPANRAANLLYSAMGCKFDKVMHGGVPRHRFIYPVAPRLDAAK
jgi:ribosomal protein S18 acetylase RimI-like enzyme